MGPRLPACAAGIAKRVDPCKKQHRVHLAVSWPPPQMSWGFKIPCKKQYSVHVVVFRDPSGDPWGLLGATNSLQKTIQDALGGFWGLTLGVLGPSWGFKFLAKNNIGCTCWFLGVSWELLLRLTRPKTGPVSFIPLCFPRLAGFGGGRRQAV